MMDSSRWLPTTPWCTVTEMGKKREKLRLSVSRQEICLQLPSRPQPAPLVESHSSLLPSTTLKLWLSQTDKLNYMPCMSTLPKTGTCTLILTESQERAFILKLSMELESMILLSKWEI